VPLAVRVGISSGPVVVGETGGGDPSVAKVAVGETPNRASRIQDLATENSVVIGPNTRRLIGGTFDLEPLGAQDFKGMAASVEVYRVVGLTDTISRFEARARGSSLTPFVGRESEIALLSERWTLAREGDGQVVLLSGEPRARQMGQGQELHCLTKTGEEIPVEISLNAIDTEGDVQVVAAVRDITERRRTEQQLRESEKRFRTVAEATPTPTVINRLSDGKVLFANLRIASIRVIPWPTRTSTWRSLLTISSGL
jgi:hypothetical protein